MDTISRLNGFVGKQAGAPGLGEGTVIAVQPSRTAMQDDIERAINWVNLLAGLKITAL